jgi:hypothetical protein
MQFSKPIVHNPREVWGGLETISKTHPFLYTPMHMHHTLLNEIFGLVVPWGGVIPFTRLNTSKDFLPYSRIKTQIFALGWEHAFSLFMSENQHSIRGVMCYKSGKHYYDSLLVDAIRAFYPEVTWRRSKHGQAIAINTQPIGMISPRVSYENTRISYHI